VKSFLKKISFVFVSFIAVNARGTEYKFSDSEVLGLWSFALGTTTQPNGAPAIVEFYQQSKFRKPVYDQALKSIGGLIDEHFQGSFGFANALPGRDEQSWNIRKHFLVEAALAKNLADFSLRTRDFLPMAAHAEIFKALAELEPLYQKMIWKPSLSSRTLAKKQLIPVFAKFQKLGLLGRVQKFYGSELPSTTLPIYLMPLPGKNGNETDTVVGGLVFAQYHMDQTDNAWEAGDIVHETSHYFYGSQSQAMQNQLLKWIDPQKDPFAALFYGVMNEALATAIGDGYAEFLVRGKLNEHPWYNNLEYDTIAKAVYPMVKNYLETNRTIDQEFIDRAKAIYLEKLPRAAFSYRRLLGSQLFLYDPAGVPLADLKSFYKKLFRISSLSPIAANERAQWEKESALGYPEGYPEEPFKSTVFFSKNIPSAEISTQVSKLGRCDEFEKLRGHAGFATCPMASKIPAILIHADTLEQFKQVVQKISENYAMPAQAITVMLP
jgi:hypothetical protein